MEYYTQGITFCDSSEAAGVVEIMSKKVAAKRSWGSNGGLVMLLLL